MSFSDLFHKLTGGRPMKVDGLLFTDVVIGKPVYACTDKFGRRWMAHGAWSWFRCEFPTFPEFPQCQPPSTTPESASPSQSS